jgi:hypothetical protein
MFFATRCIVLAILAMSTVLGGGCDARPAPSGPTSAPASAAGTAPSAAAPPTPPAISASPASAATPAPTAPPLKLEPAVLDLGFMAPRAGGRGTVKLTNTGTEPLTIAAVTPSCKCTTTSALAGKVIAPGASETLEAVLDGAALPQTHRASIKVAVEGYSDVLEIQLRGETANPVRCIPSILNAVEGKPRSGRFVVESIDRRPFRICAVGGRAPEYIGYSPSEPPRSQYLVKFDLDSWTPEPPAYLVIETDRADCPVLDLWVRTERTIPRSVFRMKDYRCNAGRIDLGGSAEVRLDMDDPGEDVLAVESGSPDVQLELLGQQVASGVRSVSVRVTPRVPRAGLVYVPFRLFGREREQPLVLFASVRTGPEGCAGCEGAPVPPSAAPGAPAPAAAGDGRDAPLRDLSKP